jgi:hypothetical protein
MQQIRLGNDPDQLVILHHRQAPNTVCEHEAGRISHSGFRGHRHHGMTHDLLDAHGVEEGSLTLFAIPPWWMTSGL